LGRCLGNMAVRGSVCGIAWVCGKWTVWWVVVDGVYGVVWVMWHVDSLIGGSRQHS